MVPIEHQGRVFPVLRLVPDEGLARRYWQALGVDPAPSSLPLTYLIFLRSERLGVDLFRELGIPRQQALHGGQRYEWHADVRVQDALDVEITVERVVHKHSKAGPLSFVDVRFDYRLADSGTLAVREITRLIKRGA